MENVFEIVEKYINDEEYISITKEIAILDLLK